MLPFGLEKFIQKGKAKFKTFAVGGSGVGTIPVQKNHFIIITGFDYFPFVDGIGDEDKPFNIYQISFNSQKSKNHFIYRNNLEDGDQGLNILLQVWRKNVYLIHEDNVHINILRVPHAENWSTIYATLPSVSQERPQPVEYGQLAAGQPAVRRIDFSPTENYLPLTNLRDDIAAPFYREQFRVDANSANKLSDIPDNDIADYSFPLLNVDYVEFNMNINEYVQASN